MGNTVTDAISQAGTNPISQPNMPSGPGRVLRLTKKQLLLFGIVLLLVIGLGLFFLYRSKFIQGPNTTSVREPNPLLAIVGSERIYLSTARNAAEEQYVSNAINDKIIKQFLDIVIERAILEQEIKKSNITIPQQKTSAMYYELVKQSIVPSQVKSVDASVISYYIPPPDKYPDRQLPEFTEQRKIAPIVAGEIEAKLKNGEKPIAVAREMYSKYPILEKILAVNSAPLKTTNEKYLQDVKNWPYEVKRAEEQFYKTLFSLKAGTIKKNIWPDGSGIAVMKIISVSSGTNQSYESWLDEKKKELVKMEEGAVSNL